jgi:hypothetical protein
MRISALPKGSGAASAKAGAGAADCFAANHRRPHSIMLPGPRTKSFLVLFFKKELLSFRLRVRKQAVLF